MTPRNETLIPCKLARQLRLAASLCLAPALPILAQTHDHDHSGHDHSHDHEPSADGGAMQLQEIVVTGTRTERPLAEVPVRTELIGSREIEVTNSRKLADVIEYQTGLRVESNCQNCNTSEIRMLGLQQRYLTLLNDGQLTFSGLAGVYGIEQIPTGILDRIEVVKGGASALYGSNAVAGVVNLIPRDPVENRFSLDFSPNWMTGSRSGDRWNTDTNLIVEWASEDGTFGILAYGFQSFVGGLDVTGDNFTEISRRDLYGGGLRAVWQPAPEWKISLDYMRTDEERRGGEGDEALDIPGHEAFITEELRSLRDVATLTLRHDVSDAFDYQAGVSLANTERRSYYGGVGPLGYASPGSRHHDPAVVRRLAQRFPQYRRALADPDGVFYNPDWSPALGYGTTDNLLINIDVSGNWRIGDNHTLTFGYQHRHESLDDDSGLGRVVSDEYRNHGFYLQHDWEITDQWEVVYGFRADKHSKVDDMIVSPRFSVKYSPTENFDLRASVATGFRASELFDEDLHVANVGGELEVVRLSPTLKEESSISYSISPNWRVTKNWEIEGSLFYTEIKDVFFNDISSDNPATAGIIESTKINSGKAEVYGGEINLIYRQGHFTSELGYVEQRSRYNTRQLVLGERGDPLDNAIYVRNFERTPERYGVVKLGYDDGVWSAFVAGKLTGPMEAPHVVSDPITGDLIGNRLGKSGYFFTVDVGTSYAWALGGNRKFTLQAGVKNLFNDFQDDLDQGPFRDPAYVYGPRFPRTVYVGAKFEF